jgi:hypothetical protein
MHRAAAEVGNGLMGDFARAPIAPGPLLDRGSDQALSASSGTDGCFAQSGCLGDSRNGSEVSITPLSLV